MLPHPEAILLIDYLKVYSGSETSSVAPAIETTETAFTETIMNQPVRFKYIQILLKVVTC